MYINWNEFRRLNENIPLNQQWIKYNDLINELSVFSGGSRKKQLPKITLFTLSNFTETTFNVSAILETYSESNVELFYGKTESLDNIINIGTINTSTNLNQVITPDQLILESGDIFYCQLKITNVDGSSFSDVQQGQLSIIEALEITFDNIENVPVIDANNVSEWNAFFDLPTYGNSFTSVELNENTVKLYGGSQIIIKPYLFSNISESVGNEHITKINDKSKCVVTVSEGAFMLCPNLTEVRLPACITITDGSSELADGAFSGSGVIVVNLPIVNYIGNFAFLNTPIINVSFPELNEIGVASFANCDSMQSFSAEQCSILGEACFDGCSILALIILPFEQITILPDDVFSGCSSITELSFINVETIGDYAFFGCESLSSLNIPYSNLTELGDSVFGYTLVPTFTFENVISVGESCFEGCKELVEINLPITENIGASCFVQCEALETINIPSCTNLGGDNTDNLVFDGILGQTITLTIPAAIASDQDVLYLQSNNNVTIVLS